MSINDAAGVTVEDVVNEMEQEEQAAQAPGWSLPEWLWIERSREPISQYRDHPFNPGSSDGVAYIIRGFSALAGGALNYWWTDVIGGLLRLRGEVSARGQLRKDDHGTSAQGHTGA